MTKRIPPNYFHGYGRVSTAHQEDTYLSLPEQTKAIREYANGLAVPVSIHNDTGSGARPWQDREILRQVLREVKRDNGAILVAAVDRLARELTIFKELVRLGIPVWVVGRGRITRKVLWEELKAAKAEHDRIRRVAKQDHFGRKEAGKKTGGMISREAAARGNVEGYLRAGDRDRQMFDLLDRNPAWEALTHKGVADLLKAAGIRNVVKKSGLERDWTRDSVQKLRLRYRKEKNFEAELDAEDRIPPLDLDGVHTRIAAAGARAASKSDDRG